MRGEEEGSEGGERQNMPRLADSLPPYIPHSLTNTHIVSFP